MRKVRPLRTAVLDFLFTSSYAPQLVLESVYATRPDPLASAPRRQCARYSTRPPLVTFDGVCIFHTLLRETVHSLGGSRAWRPAPCRHALNHNLKQTPRCRLPSAVRASSVQAWCGCSHSDTLTHAQKNRAAESRQGERTPSQSISLRGVFAVRHAVLYERCDVTSQSHTSPDSRSKACSLS